MTTSAELFNQACAEHQQGKLADAEQLYRQVLASEPQLAEAWHLLGLATHQQGRHDEALPAIQKAISLDSSRASYFNHLGATFNALGRRAEAIDCLRRAVELNPYDPSPRYNLGVLLHHQRQLDEARTCYLQTLQIAPAYGEAHFNLAYLERECGNLGSAAEHFQRAAEAGGGFFASAMLSLSAVEEMRGNPLLAELQLLRLVEVEPENPEAHFRLGVLRQTQQRPREAIEAFKRSVRFDPTNPETFHQLGCLYRDQHELDKAEDTLRMAVKLGPENPVLLANLGWVLYKRKSTEVAFEFLERAVARDPACATAQSFLGAALRDERQFDKARPHLTEAIRLDPARVEFQIQYGALLHYEGKAEEAIAVYRRALALAPGESKLHFSLGAALEFKGEIEEALRSYTEALRLKPDNAQAQFNRGMALLSVGRFREGWSDYAERMRSPEWTTRVQHVAPWDGSPLGNRTLLVHCEQGLGDTLQFVRYMPLLEKFGGRRTLLVQDALVPLLSASGYFNVQGTKAPFPACDVHISLLSLPKTFDTTVETVPANVPYMSADSVLVERWRTRITEIPGRKIGIVWQGNPDYTFDHLRSVPLAAFAPVAAVPGVQLVSLQKETQTAGAAPTRPFKLIEFGQALDQGGAFMDSAAILMNLDLLITSDTAMAHLAGSLGRPVWLALSAVPDWRWMRSGDTSPWYPTMRVFRQQRLGDWSSVFQSMAQELARTA